MTVVIRYSSVASTYFLGLMCHSEFGVYNETVNVTEVWSVLKIKGLITER